VSGDSVTTGPTARQCRGKRPTLTSEQSAATSKRLGRPIAHGRAGFDQADHGGGFERPGLPQQICDEMPARSLCSERFATGMVRFRHDIVGDDANGPYLLSR
jgi:hypothetical protein